MAEVRVGLSFITGPAVAAAKRMQANVDRLRKGFEKLTVQSNRTKAAFILFGRRGMNVLRDLESNAAKLGRRFGGLRGAIGKAAIGFAAFRAAQTGIDRETSERRLRLLTTQYGEFAKATEIAERAAKKFNLSQTEANTQLSRLIARLRPMGLSMEQIETSFAGFNTATILAGATASESAGAFLQLSQALGSGVLRGQELNSILEQAPLIAQAIAQEMGTTVGALKKFGEEGQITSSIVIAALERVAKDGAGQLEEALGGPAAAIKSFQNAAEEVGVALTDEVIPQLTESFKLLAEIILELKPVIKSVGDFAAGVLGGINDAIQRIRDPGKLAAEQQKFFAEGRMKAAMKGGQRGLANLPAGYKEQEAALFAAAAPTPIVTPPPLAIKPPGGTDGGVERVDMSQKMLQINQRLRAEQEAGNEILVATLELMQRRQEISESILLPTERQNELEEAASRFRMKVLDIEEQIAREREKNAADAHRAFQDQIKQQEDLAQAMRDADPFTQMKRQMDELLNVQNQVAAGATVIGNAFAGAFKSVITGSKSAEDALKDMLAATAEHFMDMAMQIIAQQLTMILYQTILKALGGPSFGSGAEAPLTSNLDFSSAFKMAEGGYVSGPTNALIGEGGEPEYVIPESKMRESMSRYSRGARGGSVIPESGSGDSAEGGGTAVAAPIDVRYTVERINSVDYVTADQFQAGMRQAADQGAKQGEQKTLKRLQMSSGTRKRLGM